MKIKYIKGDLFKTDIHDIVHGCNDMGVMGSGVALIIRNQYPEAYNGYVHVHETVGLYRGAVYSFDSNGKRIHNMISQSGFGRDGKRFVKYDWVATGFAALNTLLDGKELAMPMIGAGLGGGDWNVIAAIIESECTDIQPVVYQL